MEESMHVGEQETSLQDQSYHTIRRKIVYLDYKPGEKLGVKTTLRRPRYGRTPVREALVRFGAGRLGAHRAPKRYLCFAHQPHPLPKAPVTSANIWKSR